MKPINLSVKTRTAIAFSASMGVATAAFRAFTANFGPIGGCIAGVVFSGIVTFAIYWSMGLPLRRNSKPA